MRTKMLPKIVIQNSTIGLGECMALLLCVFFLVATYTGFGLTCGKNRGLSR